MAISFACPHRGRKFNMPDPLAGQQALCKGRDQTITIIDTLVRLSGTATSDRYVIRGRVFFAYGPVDDLLGFISNSDFEVVVDANADRRHVFVVAVLRKLRTWRRPVFNSAAESPAQPLDGGAIRAACSSRLGQKRLL